MGNYLRVSEMYEPYTPEEVAQHAAEDVLCLERIATLTANLHPLTYPWSGVYFVAGGGLVKIGIGHTVHKRVRSLRNQSPTPLTELGWIACDPTVSALVEASLHAQFASIRQHAEWFTLTPEIEAFITRSVTACSWPRL